MLSFDLNDNSSYSNKVLSETVASPLCEALKVHMYSTILYELYTLFSKTIYCLQGTDQGGRGGGGSPGDQDHPPSVKNEIFYLKVF